MTPSSPPRGHAAALRAEQAAGKGRQMLPSRARLATNAGALARYRFLVGLAKWLLPVGALAVLAAIVLWPEFDRGEGGRMAFRRMAQTSAEALRLASPRYQGIDEQNRPYNVTAATALQQAQSAPIDLERPRADMLMSNGAWVLLEAQQGHYQREANQLALQGQVTLWHDDGSTLRTEAADIDIAAGGASGDRPVAAQGPFGTLVSEGFRLENRGQVVVFTGRAKAVLEGGR